MPQQRQFVHFFLRDHAEYTRTSGRAALQPLDALTRLRRLRPACGASVTSSSHCAPHASVCRDTRCPPDPFYDGALSRCAPHRFSVSRAQLVSITRALPFVRFVRCARAADCARFNPGRRAPNVALCGRSKVPSCAPHRSSASRAHFVSIARARPLARFVRFARAADCARAPLLGGAHR